MSRLKNSFPIVLGLITIGLIMGVVITTSFDLDKKSIAGTEGAKIYTEEDTEWSNPDDKATISNFNPNGMFVDMVKKVRPTIVSIYTEKSVKVDLSPFYRFLEICLWMKIILRSNVRKD